MPTVPVAGRANLTDGQWAVLEPLLPVGRKPGRPRKWQWRQLIDGIRWRTRAGARWRDVPPEYGPWTSVYGLFGCWQRDGTWAAVAAFLAEAAELNSLDPRRRPLPAVLDTDFIRTGLHAQLSKGTPPRSVRSAQDGSLRLFMEYDTLVETAGRLPRFSEQLGVPVAELRRILNEEWLPQMEVVQVPPGLRELDPRALRVRDGDGVRLGDAADFPAAALAALVSPCLLLTHNYKHFGALGVRTRQQGVDGVMAVLAINIGEVQLQAVIWVPALAFRVAGATMDWATEKIGGWAWVILGVAVAQDTDLGHPCASWRCHPESLSAAQIAELLDPAVRPPVAEVRDFLRANDRTVFNQVRRGSFVLGRHYQLGD